ncbi:ArsR/SmtB family transcription factor [Streptomyces sp. RPT161]|uniref:ArsR/SmtB family transcription factor n=1 Tax=Streptomyces sp. RPT161 TaxID=3015993 RepID=UPI0022B9021E|nr:winged helix-turn-helix domain-containing protein [Streptomyces sp. RPT161]
MLRIHFTTDDFTRTRIALAPDPMWEILLSLHLLKQREEGAVVFGQWRARLRARPDATVAPLASLAPPRGYSPDFLTPTGTVELGAGIDSVLSTSPTRLRSELTLLAAQQPLTAWTHALADGRTEPLRQLGVALQAYYERALAPHWAHINFGVDADRSHRARVLADHGLGQMLSGLHPSMRWQNSTVLSLPYGPCDRDLHLDGRGLLLVPSFFCWRRPICLRDPELPPTLVYPIDHELGWDTADGTTVGEPSCRPLSALLGRTRAAALEAIAKGCTTTELAARLSVSPATASEHTTTLRQAGLVISHRYRRSVCHTLTSLGLQLLHCGRPIRVPANCSAEIVSVLGERSQPARE